jgi:hypothetical protein
MSDFTPKIALGRIHLNPPTLVYRERPFGSCSRSENRSAVPPTDAGCADSNVDWPQPSTR